MPILNPNDATQLDRHLTRFFEVNDGERANVLRGMFVGEMDFESAQGLVPLQPFPSNVVLPESGELIASSEGFNVVYTPLNITDSARVRNSEAVQVAKRVNDTLGPDMVLVISNTGTSQIQFIYPEFETATPTLRRIVVERDLPRRTAVQQLSNCYHDAQQTTLRQALTRAYDVDKVTQEFFREYRNAFDQFEELIFGFGNETVDLENKRLFTQTALNRLMFVYFLSRKGWLTFRGNTDYLNELWRDHTSKSDGTNFYNERLKNLYFAGLNDPQCRDLITNNPALHALIGDVKFLNGGLFERTDLDLISEVEVPDEAIKLVLDDRLNHPGLFNRFNFTVMESTPFDVEVAVDPEMLGKVFEELVTGRHESGSYYTPRIVVSYMCREALKSYLARHVDDFPEATITAFVDDHDISDISFETACLVSTALAEIKVIDPACGSGAYLLGMMQELTELRTLLYNQNLHSSSQDLHRLKLHIIQNNLYGADIDQFAVNIAMLRLWLSLSVDTDDDAPEALPNLGFKIVCGDSLSAPISSDTSTPQLIEHAIQPLAEKIGRLKNQHLTAVGEQKSSLQDTIDDLQNQVRQLMGSASAPNNPIYWQIEFAEVFAERGGFDVTIANPPYVSAMEFIRSRPKSYRTYLKLNFSTARGAWDLYILFFERCIDLLNSGGVLCFITPNKYLSAPYAKELRRFMLSRGAPTVLCDISQIKIFPTAAVNPVITLFVNEIGTQETVSCVLPTQQMAVFNPRKFEASQLDRTTLEILPDNIWGFLLSPHVKLLMKIVDGALPLENFGTVQATSTAAESDEYGDYLTETPSGPAFKVINTGLIDPYEIKWGRHRFIHSGSRYSTPHLPVPKISSNRAQLYSRPKVLFAKLSKRPEAAVDAQGEFGGLNINCFHSPVAGVSIEFIAGFCNSNIFRFLYEQFFGALRMGPSYQFQSPQLRTIPLRKLAGSFQSEIVRLVEQLIQVESPDKQKQMKEIDKIFYDAYELTASEIQELEGTIDEI